MTTFSLADFFARHFADLGPDEFIEIRAFPKDAPVARSWHVDALAAARAALGFPGGVDVYFSTNAKQKNGGEKKHVTKVRALHADLDFKCFADGREGALAAINAFPLSPTVVVDSGNGFHAYWYLREPVEPDPSIEALLKRLYLRLGEMATKPLDGVQDLSRVMRTPGTFNNKTTPAKMAQVRHTEYEAVYTLADFERLLPIPAEPVRPAWSPPSGSAGRSVCDDIPSIAEMREILSFTPPQRSYQEWQTTLAAVHSVYPGPEGVALCEAWSPGKPGEIARKFASFKRDGRAQDAASVGTLIYIAKQNGYQPPAPRLAQASAKSTTTENPDDGDAIDVLALAEALDTAQRTIAALEAKLARCQDEHRRKDALIASQARRIDAFDKALSYPDPTMGGAAFDFAEAAFQARERGQSKVEEGVERFRVCLQTAANRRSSTTIGNAKRKYKEHDLIDFTEHTEAVEAEGYKGQATVAYVAIPERCATPEDFVLHLLSKPIEKRQGGARRKRDLPIFDEPVEGPIEIKTETKQIYREVATEKVLKVTPLETRTEYCDPQGYQLTIDEVNAFRESVGLKIKVPGYRPQVVPTQMVLSEADRDLTTATMTRDEFDRWLDEEPPPPIALHDKRCAVPGCPFPKSEGDLCDRHAATYAMTGAD